MNSLTLHIKTVIALCLIGVSGVAESPRDEQHRKRTGDLKGLGSKHPRVIESNAYLRTLDSDDKSSKDGTSDSETSDKEPVHEEDSIIYIMITIPVYKNEDINAQVLQETFSILGILLGEKAFDSLEFKEERILVKSRSKYIFKFVSSFLGKFQYGIQHGDEALMRRVWARGES